MGIDCGLRMPAFAVAVSVVMPASVVLVLGAFLAQTVKDADFDADFKTASKVGFSDFLLFARAFGSDQARYDLDRDAWWTHQGNTWEPFVKTMWDRYRDSLPVAR